MKKTLITGTIILLALISPATAIDLNSSTSLRYFPDSGPQEFAVDTEGNLNMTGDNITNFFDQDECGQNEAVKTVYSNGSYECETISSTTDKQNLSETLTAGNVANRSMRFRFNSLRNLDSVTSPESKELIDGFEDATLSEWPNDGGLTTTSGTSADGSYSVVSTSDNFRYVSSTKDSLPVPERGDSFSFKALSVGGSKPGVSFGSENPGLITLNSGYWVGIDFGTAVIKKGNPQNNIAFGPELQDDQWYKFEVSWEEDGTIQVSVINDDTGELVGSFETQDTQFNGPYSGPTLADAGAYSAYVDSFRLIENRRLDIKGDTKVEGELDLSSNNLTGVSNLEGFFDQTKCADDEAIKTVYPNGSYECNSISTTTEAENLSETLSTGNSVGENNVDVEDQNITSSVGNVTIGTDLKVYGDIWTQGQPPTDSLSEVLNEGNTASTKIDMDGNNISNIGNLENFFDQDRCGDDEAIKTVYPNGSYACNSISTTTEAENLSETLAAGNVANRTINLSGNNITDARKIEFQDAGGDILNVDQLSLSEGSSDFRLRVGGEKFLDEDFEDESLSPFSNDGSNDVDWEINSSSKFGGFSAEAGDTGNNEISKLNVNISGGQKVVFKYLIESDRSQFKSNEEDSTFFSTGKHDYKLAKTEGEWRVAGFDISESTENLSWRMDSSEDVVCDPDVEVWKCGGNFNTTFKIDDVRVFNTTEDAVSIYGTQTLNTGDLDEVNRINMVQGVEIGQGTNATDFTSTAIGREAKAAGEASLAIGSSSNSSSQGAMSLGDSSASGNGALAFGRSSSASGNYGVSLGDSSASGNGALAFGRSSSASGNDALAFGRSSSASGFNDPISIGFGSSASRSDSISIGDNSNASGNSSVAIGDNASSRFYNSIALGHDSYAADNDDIAIGNSSDALGQDSIAIGAESSTEGNDATAFGEQSSASGQASVALGSLSDASGDGSVALGFLAESSADDSVAIGYESVADEQYTVELGSSSQAYDLNVNGGSIAAGSNTQSGLSSGDINASDIYYDTLTAKSPVVQCSAGTDWCKVSEPSKQQDYFVKTDESFDKDRPRETAVEVVESDVQTAERFEELREENQKQEERIEELNETVQGLKLVVCKDHPEAEVCR